MGPRLALGLVVPALLIACAEDFKPAALVDKLRVLAVTAEAPMLHPGETARLGALVVDPTDPGRKNSVLWVACDPDPRNLEVNACAQFSNLRDPGDFLSGCVADGCPKGERCDLDTKECAPGCTTTGCPAEELCNAATETCVPRSGVSAAGARFIGFNDLAFYAAPRGLFDEVAPDDRHRVTGLVATLLGMVFGEEIPFPPKPDDLRGAVERARNGDVQSVLFLKRVPIVDAVVPANKTPVARGLRVGEDEYLAGGLVPRLWPGQKASMNVLVDSGAAECFAAMDAQGNPVEELTCWDTGQPGKLERLVAVWFTTAGTYKEGRTSVSYATNEFTAPTGTDADPLPPDRAGTWWAVLQDGRGGASWVERTFYVCDESQPAPVFESVEPVEATPGDRITVRGRNLDQILDVAVAGLPVRPEPGASAEIWVGTIPKTAPRGPTAVVLRAKNCGDVSLPFSVR